MERSVRRAIEERANWLEDVLAGLMINGVTIAEIDIQHHPGRTVVRVRGVVRYEHHFASVDVMGIDDLPSAEELRRMADRFRKG